MALTREQLKNLGFTPMRRTSIFKRRYNSLIYRLTDDTYLYIGKSDKFLFKSFIDPETKERLSVMVINLGDTGYREMKDYLEREKRHAGNYKKALKEA